MSPESLPRMRALPVEEIDALVAERDALQRLVDSHAENIEYGQKAAADAQRYHKWFVEAREERDALRQERDEALSGVELWSGRYDALREELDEALGKLAAAQQLLDERTRERMGDAIVAKDDDLASRMDAAYGGERKVVNLRG